MKRIHIKENIKRLPGKQKITGLQYHDLLLFPIPAVRENGLKFLISVKTFSIFLCYCQS